MRSHWSAVIATTAALAATERPAVAVEAGGALSLTLDEAIARAERESPLVRRARREREVIAAARPGAAQLFPANPWVAGAVGWRRDASTSKPPAAGVEGGVHLEQAVEIGGQRGARLHELERAVDLAAAREHLALVETRARARRGYVALQLTRVGLDSALRRQELGERLFRSAERRVAAGAASDVELHLAEVERGRLTHERIEAELGVQAASSELARLIGLSPSTPLSPTTPLERPALPTAPLERLTAEALVQRAELRALAASRALLDAEIVRLRREIIPNPALFVDFGLQQPAQLYVGGGVGFALPVWRRNQGELSVARAEQRRSDEEHALVEREIALEITLAWRAALARGAEAELWGGQVVPAADANVELVSEGWRAGKFDLFRVIQAAREAGEARRKQLEVMGELWRAAIELDRARGSL